jgi:uncharacterized protein YndB with AHSA1/START domain
MEQLHYTTDVDAPRSRVWKVLWDDASYRDWTSVFAEGSYAVSDWQEGSRIQFIDPTSNAGMVAIIETRTPNEHMCFRHIAELRDGREHPFPESGVGRERYTLTETDGGTRLRVDLDAPAEYRQMFDDKFPKALRRVKELSEG